MLNLKRAILTLVLLSPLCAAAAPLLQYSQDGKNYIPFSVLTGREKVRNYYDYYNNKGHPDFGLVQGVTTAALYYDAKRDALSLIVVSGSGMDTGKVSYGFKNLPSTTYLSLADDPAEFSYGAGTSTAEALFRWNSSADGVVFSGLENQQLNIKLSIKPFISVSGLRLAAANNQFITLDLNRPLYISNSVTTPPPVPPAGGGSNVGGSNPPPAVPEPSGLAIAGALLLGLLNRRRTR